MSKKTVSDLELAGKRVFMRVDFNVPLSEDGKVENDKRIRAALPTILYLQEHGAKLIIASHLGRPKGQVNAKYSLRPVAARLGELLGAPVLFAPDCVGAEVEAMAAALEPGQVLLLENVRFHAEEEKNDPDFAKALAGLADIYVNDAFGTAHRAHASTEGIAHFLPAVAGFLLEAEVDKLMDALAAPEHPFAAILGGAKISDKLGVVDHLLGRVDRILIGGGMANTFLVAQGYPVGRSLFDEERVAWAKALLASPSAAKLMLPVDMVVAKEVAAGQPCRVVDLDGVAEDEMALDIGPKTAAQFADYIKQSKTVVWNGPMGVFEIPEFSAGTRTVAQALADSDCLSIVGGGDSASAVEHLGLADKMSHVSTGGGASLECLAGKLLPGVAVLLDK